ncbi:MAG: hypothetical protein ACLTCB_03830 [Merdibacter sp.]
MRSAQVDIERIGDHLIDMDTAGDYQGSSSDGWLNPIGGPTSPGPGISWRRRASGRGPRGLSRDAHPCAG